MDIGGVKVDMSPCSPATVIYQEQYASQPNGQTISLTVVINLTQDEQKISTRRNEITRE